MPRKTRRPAEFRIPIGTHHPPPLWPRYIVICVLSALAGAGIMYAVLRPALKRAARPAIVSVAPPVSSEPAPPAELTQGLSPAEAAVRLGDWYEDHAQWAQAINAFQQAFALGVTSPDVRTDLGVAYYKSGQPQAALAQYQLAQDGNPRHENSLFNQGSVYAVMGNTVQAVKVWRDYIRRFPGGQHVADARALIAQVQAHGSALPAPPSQ